nr:GTP cyclohydrolase, FolE2/MptA family [Burkholderiaceae bacterium]
MNARDPIFSIQALPDIQARVDERKLAIQRVGVKGITHPITLLGRGGAQATIAQLGMYVALPEDQKGTHMSRFLEVLHEQREPLSASALAQLLDRMLERLSAQAGAIELSCPYFVMKTAPVSGVESLMNYEVRLIAERTSAAGLRVTQEVGVPVTSLCPCSKEISDYGAH